MQTIDLLVIPTPSHCPAVTAPVPGPCCYMSTAKFCCCKVSVLLSSTNRELICKRRFTALICKRRFTQLIYKRRFTQLLCKHRFTELICRYSFTELICKHRFTQLIYKRRFTELLCKHRFPGLICKQKIYTADLQMEIYTADLQAQIYSADFQALTYTADLQAQIYGADLQAQIYTTDLQAQIYRADLEAQIYRSLPAQLLAATATLRLQLQKQQAVFRRQNSLCSVRYLQSSDREQTCECGYTLNGAESDAVGRFCCSRRFVTTVAALKTGGISATAFLILSLHLRLDFVFAAAKLYAKT